jgi:hypothetical protein
MRRRPRGERRPGASAGGGLTAPVVDSEPTATLAEPTAPAVVAENVPQREVKLTLSPSRRLRAAWCCAAHGLTLGRIGMRSDEVVRKRC